LKIIYTPEGFSQRYGGVSRVFAELATRLNQTGHHAYLAAGLYMNEYIRGMEGVIGCYFPRKISKLTKAINTGVCGFTIASIRNAVVHQTYYSQHYYPRNHPWVLTVYDMTHETYSESVASDSTPKIYPNKLYCCKRADHICAISHRTKDDLIRILGIPKEKISVTYLGNALTNVTPRPIGTDTQKKYLLVVGGRRWYKNVPRLLQAFQASGLLKQNYCLICFGGGKFVPEELDLIRNLKLQDHVFHREGDDQLLAGYYKHAAAHISVSLSEGFGLTLVEAMGLGCPVICSDRSSLPEVGGDAAVYFNPEDVDDIRNTIERTVFDTATLERLSQLGKRREKLFTWDRCFAETLTVYQQVA
jgi:glycosyltransferase involved in cell wall biosynthesis